MGHAIFIVLHVVAALFFFWALLVTVPLHLIYAVVSGRGEPPERAAPAEPSKKCPTCAETVLEDAFKCKHCGAHLLEEEVRAALREKREFEGFKEIPVDVPPSFIRAVKAIEETQARIGPDHPLTAHLRPDPSGPHGRNTVRVSIGGHPVGYLPRNLAAKFDAAFRRQFQTSRVTGVAAPSKILSTDPPVVVVYLEDEFADALAA